MIRRLVASFMDLPVRRKLFAIGVALAVPLIVLIGVSVWSNVAISHSAKRALSATEKYEQHVRIAELLDRISKVQTKLLRYATEVAASRFEPYGDEALYPEIRAAADELEVLTGSLPALLREDAEISVRVERTAYNFYLSQNLIDACGVYRGLLEDDLRAALRRAADSAKRYSEIFQSYGNLLTHHEGSLMEKERLLERQAAGDRDALIGVYRLRVARTRYFASASAALLDRFRPYLDDRYRAAFRTESVSVESALSGLSRYAAAREYSREFQIVRGLVERDIENALVSWSTDRGAAELGILQIDKRLTSSNEAMSRIVSDLTENMRSEIRRLSNDRSAALESLRMRSDGLLRTALAVGAAVLFVCFLFFRIFVRGLADPLRSAVDFARAVEQGAPPIALPIGRRDEIGALFEALNRMEGEIARKESALMESNERLEARVAERTDHLEKTLAELSAAQDQLVIQGKLAAIGRLSAAMAHDLNTPLGAIVSANNSLSEQISAGMRSSISFGFSATNEELEWLLRAYDSVVAMRGPLRPRRRSERKALADELKGLGFPDPERWAETMAELGLDKASSLPPIAFPYARALELLELLVGFVLPRRLTRIIAEAGEKAAAVVSDLQQYLRSEESEIPESFSLLFELSGAVSLFAERLSIGVDVRLECAEDLRAYGARRKLSQVWINLISNALHAMEYQGALTITGTREEDWVVVRVADTGKGIPAEVGDRVFEPFFTTKRTGDGMGLGLDICRSIVRKNGGDISFTSKPGATVFRVRIPVFEP